MTRRIRVEIRWYKGAPRRHVYRKADLDEAAAKPLLLKLLRPVCHDLAVLAHDLTHVFDMIDQTPHAGLGDAFTGCVRCGIWLLENPHELVVGDRIVAYLEHPGSVGSVGGELPIPREPDPRERVARQPAMAVP